MLYYFRLIICTQIIVKEQKTTKFEMLKRVIF